MIYEKQSKQATPSFSEPGIDLSCFSRAGTRKEKGPFARGSARYPVTSEYLFNLVGKSIVQSNLITLKKNPFRRLG
jgi:hypothetical protein